MSKIVFVLGPPASGKTRQCSFLEDYFGFVHITLSELTEENKLLKPIKELMNSARKLITFELSDVRATRKFIILDGYPETMKQLEYWEKSVAQNIDLQMVLFLDCPLQKCLLRGLERQSFSRKDVDEVQQKIDYYVKNTLPVIEHFRTMNLVRQINGDMTCEKVFVEVQKVFRIGVKDMRF
ncbi:unnamed protein product [Brassicogethes aeneus]|uniref:Adenylate kinase n=1 Tax=Brassicogethes aeneus TaxID=1431903 RepID=A0A9P0FNX5_BRAAE|nr:unnamed protein product [Brassicogethes aeneus]